MFKSLKRIALPAMIASAVVLAATAAMADAVPKASQLLTEVGLSADAVQRVLAGEFVSADVPAVSERDLSIALAFVVKSSPADLAKQIVAGELVSADANVKARGLLTGASTPADLKKLQIASATASAFAGAKAGSDLNLSTDEIAAFNAAGAAGALDQLRAMLLKRYQSYRASGLAGIAAYDRGGSSSDPAADLRAASESSPGLKKYLPSLQQTLVTYPKAAVTGLKEDFYWLAYDIDGKPTYVLTHIMAAPDGDAAVVVQRQYYVSTGYNAEQAVAGFLPVEEGTVVVYVNHTFTDQVAGFGGSMKRSIGRNMMESQLKKVFEKARSMAKP